MELNEQAYGDIMEKLGAIQADVASIKRDVGGANQRMDGHEGRLRALEQKPGKWWDKLAGAAIGAVVAAVVAVLIK